MGGSRLTPRGWGLCAVGLGIIVLAAIAGQPDLVWPGVFLLALPLVSSVLLLATQPRYRVQRDLTPGVVAVGDPATVELTITALAAVGAAPALAFDDLPRAVGTGHRFVVPGGRPGTTCQESYTVQPRRRGRWVLDGLRYEVSDVLGLAQRSARVPGPATLAVTPTVLPLEAGPGAAFGRHGETPIPQAAIAGPDDVLVREYQPRDDVRRVHWRSTARTGTLMVRREEQAWNPTAWIVLDSRALAHPATGEVRPTFEWLLTVAASIGTALLDEDYEVSIADASGTTFTASAQREPGAVLAWLDHLVDADVTEDGSLRRAARAVAQAPTGHLVVAVLAQLDIETAQHLVTTHDRQQTCRAIVLPQPNATLAHEAGRVVLTDHGWAVATCPVEGDLDAVWRGFAAGGGGRS